MTAAASRPCGPRTWSAATTSRSCSRRPELVRLRPTPRQVEIGYPWLGGFIAWALAVRLLPNWVYAGGAVRTLADPIVNVAAIAIAFFVAVAGLLRTLEADPLIREPHRDDAFPTSPPVRASAVLPVGAAVGPALAVHHRSADAGHRAPDLVLEPPLIPARRPRRRSPSCYARSG